MSLNTQLDSNVLNFLNMSGKHFRRKKFSQEEIFTGRNFRNLVFDCENLKNFCLTNISHYMVHGAILYRNHRLFCCVFDHIIAFKVLYC